MSDWKPDLILEDKQLHTGQPLDDTVINAAQRNAHQRQRDENIDLTALMNYYYVEVCKLSLIVTMGCHIH